VIVNNLNALWSFVGPDETHSKLIVHPDTVLPPAVALQGLQAVPRWHSQEVETGGGVQLVQLPPSHCLNTDKAGDTASPEQVLGIGAMEGQDQARRSISHRDTADDRAYLHDVTDEGREGARGANKAG
jgi:hypothetical protein